MSTPGKTETDYIFAQLQITTGNNQISNYKLFFNLVFLKIN